MRASRSSTDRRANTNRNRNPNRNLNPNPKLNPNLNPNLEPGLHTRQVGLVVSLDAAKGRCNVQLEEAGLVSLKPANLKLVGGEAGAEGNRGAKRPDADDGEPGMEGMTKAMAIEWGLHSIRVNTVCPTFIRTPLAEQTLAIPERRAWIEGMIKLGRLGEIEDVMGPVVFLASDAAALTTGTSLLVDGGWTAE